MENFNIHVSIIIAMIVSNLWIAIDSIASCLDRKYVFNRQIDFIIYMAFLAILVFLLILCIFS